MPLQSMDKPSICFVAPTAYPLIANDHSVKHIGGAELQQAILARALAKRGFNVSIICMDHGQENGVIIDGVTVYRAYSPTQGIPVLRFISPRATSLWRCLKQANADIYYQRAAGMLTGLVAQFTKTYDKQSIYAAASNYDFLKNTPKIKYKRDRLLYEYGLRKVGQVVVQNKEQGKLLNSNFSRCAEQINNAYAPPSDAKNDKKGYVLWVSTVREIKQPHLFLDLAKQLPQYQFKMVGGPGDKELYEQIKLEAAQLDNLEFCGFVPITEVEAHYDGSRLVINTSKSEGFPNAFLQAWARSIPTVSFFDCGARTEEGAEISDRVETLSEMQQRVSVLIDDDDFWEKRGYQAQDYFIKNHSVESVVTRLESVFERLLG